MVLAQKSINTKSFFNLNKENLEKFKREYKQSMYKSAYGASFGRKETDIADTNILTYKKLDELPSSKVLNKTSKTFLTKWSLSGEDKTYVSLVILVIKGIFTFWKQTLPKETTSHILHAWYEPHEKQGLTRMDKVGKSTLIGRINNVQSKRPQSTSSNLYARKRKSATVQNTKKDKGMDDIIANRKKFLLRGNGNITGFYDPPEGMVSSYETQFKTCKSTKAMPRTGVYNYTSSIMTVTPDPTQFKKQGIKHENMKKDMDNTHKKLSNTDSVLHRAINRALDYQQNENIAYHMNGPMRQQLRRMNGNAGPAYRNRANLISNSFMNMNNKTPMPVRFQNLMGS